MPSTAVDWAHWKNGVMTVKYRGGAAYDYFGVPEEVYRAYTIARSKGTFVNTVVKPNFPYERRAG